MAKIYLTFLFICLALIGCGRQTSTSPADTRIVEDFNPQPLLNSVDEIIQKAIGSGVNEQIPGYTFHDNEVNFTSGGIECPTNVSSVEMAVDLLNKKLASNFSGKMDTPKIDRFPPKGDVVFKTILTEKMVKVHIAISIFQRGSSRVILFPMFLAKKIDATNYNDSR